VTFHDLFVIDHPEWYNGAFARWYQFMLRRLARNALHLIAVSEYTKERLVKVMGRDPSEITVVHNGPAATIQLTDTHGAARAGAALALPSRRYVLSLSSLESRKNLRGLLDAWRIAQASLPDNVWLVLAGPEADSSVYGRQKELSIPPRVHFTGYVPEEHLAGLYSGASLFVYPSLAEGFGLPLLEAMRCGLRTVTSNNSSLPEVGGDAAAYVDPLNPRELAEAMLRNLTAESAAASPYAASLEQAAKFSWDTAAQRTEDVLRRASAMAPMDLASRASSWSVA
jgi:glycosyltransferase involved in cell wall biosynthesis